LGAGAVCAETGTPKRVTPNRAAIQTTHDFVRHDMSATPPGSDHQ
jgi:hypothetical protein